MRDELMTERSQYEDFVREAEQALYATGEHPHAKNPVSRVGMWFGLQMNTLLDSSSPHIADILIQGAAMGIAGMARDRNNLPEASPQSRDIADRFIAAQHTTIDRLAGSAGGAAASE